jgi:cobalt/nickel transport system permease protein
LVVFLIGLATAPRLTPLLLAGYLTLLAAGLILSALPPLGVLFRSLVILPFSGVFALVSWISGDSVKAVSLIEKSYLSVVAVLLLVGTTPFPSLMTALETLGVPRFLVLVIQFLYRYLFVISEQAQHMRVAASCRAGSGSRLVLRAAAGAVAVLFSRSYERAEGIHRAMISRGFQGHFPMAAGHQIGWADVMLLTVVVCCSVALR